MTSMTVTMRVLIDIERHRYWIIGTYWIILAHSLARLGRCNLLQVASKKLTPDKVAQIIELNSYLTCCKLQPYHQFLALKSAMGACFKAENFVTAASFAKRMAQGNFGPPEKTKDDVQKARQVLQICEQKGTDKHKIRFDFKAAVEDIKICSGSLQQISAQETPIYCPYCGSSYLPSFKGKLCDVCGLSEIGANTLGIQLRPI